MPKSKMAKTIEILFKILLGLGIIGLFIIPYLYDLMEIFGLESFNTKTLLYKILFYICYIICLGIIFMLNYIFKNIYKDSPFNKKIINSLKTISLLFMILAVLIIVKLIYFPTILSIALIVVSFITSLCFYTLAQIFKVATEYKNEIDYTV